MKQMQSMKAMCKWLPDTNLKAGLFLCVNSSPNDKILDQAKLADDNFNVDKMTTFVSDKVKKTLWEKDKKCWSPASSPFPTMFLTGFFFRVVKSWDCVVKG